MQKNFLNKDFSCYLCKNKNHSIIAKKEEIRFNCYNCDKYILKCNKCGLVQLYPMWTEEELKNLYINYNSKKDFENFKRKKVITFYLKKYIKKDDKILEIGCGLGDNLKKLKKEGYNIIGIDKDPTVCDNNLIFNIDINDFKCGEEKFDFIYAIQVFEHINNPLNFIYLVVNNLKHKGKFLFEFPNIDGPLVSLYKIKEFKKFYWYPYHLFFYNRKIAKKLFNNFNSLKIDIKLIQRYGLINHLYWIFFKKPCNFNQHIPILDDIYKFILISIFKVSDTLLVIGEKSE
jgi:SAM-dependent methyltransferase